MPDAPVTVEWQMTADFRTLDRVTVRDQPVKAARTYVIQAGAPGLRDP